jgi:hypothetical protein
MGYIMVWLGKLKHGCKEQKARIGGIEMGKSMQYEHNAI